MKTICIDAGHGGKDPGACAGGVHEKDIALYTVFKIGTLLADYELIYTRFTDVYVSLSESPPKYSLRLRFWLSPTMAVNTGVPSMFIRSFQASIVPVPIFPLKGISCISPMEFPVKVIFDPVRSASIPLVAESSIERNSSLVYCFPIFFA